MRTRARARGPAKARGAATRWIGARARALAGLLLACALCLGLANAPAALCGAGAVASASPRASENAPARAAQAAAPAAASPERRYDSPREAMRAFYEAIARYKDGHRRDKTWLLQAESALDLSGLSERVRTRFGGESTAIDLLFVLDHLVAASPHAALPGAEQLERGQTLYAWEPPIPAEPSQRARIEFALGSDGSWRISANTVARVRELWDAMAGQELLVERPLTPTELLRERIVPAPLQEVGFLLEHWQWIALALLLVLGFLVDRCVRWLSGRVVVRLAGQQRGLLDPQILKRFERPVGMFVGALAIRASLPVLDLELGYFSSLDFAVSAFLAASAVWAALRLVDLLSNFLEEKAAQTESKFDDMLVPLLRRTLKVCVLVAGLSFVIWQASEDPWSIVAGLSVSSIALGFAARDSIENLFGTFTVLLDKPFQLGEYIKMGEVEGSVEQVGLRSTRIRTPIDSLISVPNRRFISDSVENLGARRWRRVHVLLGFTYGSPPERIEAFCEGARELVRRHPSADQERYFVHLKELSASSVDVQFTCYIESPSFAVEARERHRLLVELLRLAQAVGLSFAFPSQTVYLARADAAAAIEDPATLDAAVARGRELALAIAEASRGPGPGPLPVPSFAAPDSLATAARRPGPTRPAVG